MECPCFIFKYRRNIVSFCESYDICYASPFILFHIIYKSVSIQSLWQYSRAPVFTGTSEILGFSVWLYFKHVTVAEFHNWQKWNFTTLNINFCWGIVLPRTVGGSTVSYFALSANNKANALSRSFDLTASLTFCGTSVTSTGTTSPSLPITFTRPSMAQSIMFARRESGSRCGRDSKRNYRRSCREFRLYISSYLDGGRCKDEPDFPS